MGNKECLHYLEQVRSELKGADRRKKEVLQQIQTAVEDYAEEHPQCTYQELTQHFGTPGQIAESYVAEMDSQEVLRKISYRKKLVIAVASGLILMLLVWAGIQTAAHFSYEQDGKGYATVPTITTNVSESV